MIRMGSIDPTRLLPLTGIEFGPGVQIGPGITFGPGVNVTPRRGLGPFQRPGTDGKTRAEG